MARRKNVDFHVYKKTINLDLALSLEEEHIGHLLNKGERLVNKTIDGKGTTSGSNFGEAIHLTRNYSRRKNVDLPPSYSSTEVHPTDPISRQPTQQAASSEWKRIAFVLGIIVLLFLFFAK